jgi:P-type Ca2+ transporter type 2C
MLDHFHSLSIEDTYKKLNTSSNGLNNIEVNKRYDKYGKNELKEKKISKLHIFFRQFHNILIYLLFAASLISILVGEWIDFFVIILIIIINGLIGFFEELHAETSIAALKKLIENKCKVKRDQKFSIIPSSEIVPGDYIILHEGDVISADIRLIETQGLTVDESTITGESIPSLKDHLVTLPKETLPYELKNMVLSGTTIVRGNAQGIVVRTGKSTYLASIAEKASDRSPDTPLIKALNFFAKRYALVLAMLFTFMGIVGYFQGRSLIELFYILVAGFVSAVPEGLPIVITLVMVIGVVSLGKKKTIIRYLPSVETLGSVTIIASDKTGTITEGKLSIKETFTTDEHRLKLIAALCNDAHEGSGDPLDIALSYWTEDFDKTREKYPRTWSYSFDVHQKLMATVNKIDNEEILFLKGAFESLKEKSEISQEIQNAFDSYVKEGLRVLAFGEGKWGNNEDPNSWKIKIIGLIGFLDSPKREVKEAVKTAKKAGIRVIMITGDHPTTAKEIAKEVGICEENDFVLNAKDMNSLSDDQLLTLLKKTNVIARVLPEQKYKIVQLLQKNKDIVAVTGDGVNDVPALKTADIGIAMGSGSEAAKSAAKMIITDNNLSVITEAVQNARVIADNIRKVIYYLVSTSLQEIFFISLAVFYSMPLPMSAIQILWINLVADGVQDKFFPFAKAESDVMKRKPNHPRKQFFNLTQLIRIISFGLPLGLICYFLYIFLLNIYPFKIVNSIVFTSVVVIQWANGIQSQKEQEPFFKKILKSFSINPFIFLGLGAGILLQCLALYVLPNIFHVIPLTLNHWKYPILMFFISFGIIEIRKWIEEAFKFLLKKK